MFLHDHIEAMDIAAAEYRESKKPKKGKGSKLGLEKEDKK